MAHDVFISHSAKDKATGDAVCAMLEANGVRCWIAPRDVVPGEEWGRSIIQAINGSRVMVLVFSSNANDSLQIRKEVERAVNKGVIIVPLRIEDVIPSESLEYFIGNVHWLDALTEPLETHLRSLAGTIKILLARIPTSDVGAHATPNSPPVFSPVRPEVVEPIPIEKAVASPEELIHIPMVPEPAKASILASMPAETAPISKLIAAEERSEKKGEKSTGPAENTAASAPFSAKPVLTMTSSNVAAGAEIPALWRTRNRAILSGVALLLVALVVVYFSIGSRVKPGSQKSNDFMEEAGKALSTPPPRPPPPPPARSGSSEDSAPTRNAKEKKSPSPLDQEDLSSVLAAANSGDAKAQFEIGNRFYWGQRGTGKDYAQALSWYSKAAEQGSAQAESILGNMYFKGEGVQRDFAQALIWYQKAADQGDAVAQGNLGNLYQSEQNYAQALIWYQKSADQGNDYAQCRLGFMYAQGHVVQQDYAQANIWLRKAADQGYAQAQFSLGVLYEYGQGVPSDLTQARIWFQKAANQGDLDAKKELAALDGRH
jgi:TPR repeat protein